MKKISIIIGLAALGLAGVQGQTNSPVSISDTNKTRAIAFVQGVSTAKSLVTTVYPSYAPQLVTNGKRDQFGFGAAALYPLGNFVYTGLRVDYLGGNFWAPSLDVGLKADVQIFGVNVTPLTYTGGIFPLSGAGDQNGQVGYIIGGGAKVDVWSGKLFGLDASLTVGATVEKWSNFPGQVFHFAPLLRISW